MALRFYGWTEDQYTVAQATKPDKDDKNVSPGEMVAYAQATRGAFGNPLAARQKRIAIENYNKAHVHTLAYLYDETIREFGVPLNQSPNTRILNAMPFIPLYYQRALDGAVPVDQSTIHMANAS